jgi:hypothetical protein
VKLDLGAGLARGGRYGDDDGGGGKLDVGFHDLGRGHLG